ncbi:MAG: dihydrolipoyl dehydrogenase [Planctomycetes bacterium]|nr:dihydrolipoyl dehydrogenase [Planctomycetota bacterium]
MFKQHYNVAIIGAGPGGYIAALKAAQMGAKVAMVEKGHLGGACLNNGCIPSKALLATAELMHTIGHAGDWGIRIGAEASFDWAEVQKRKDKVIASLRGGIKGLFAARGVVVFKGAAKLESTGGIVVTDQAGKADQLTADKTIIAVGSVPAEIPGWPSDPQRVCTSDEALHWPALPSRLLIVGGGVIGCEFACMMQPLGVEVTVVEMLPTLLPEMDAELGSALKAIFTMRKIRCFTDTKVQDLTVTGEEVRATLSNGESVVADKVLVAAGRHPATDGLGLQTMGLTTDKGFVRVNDQMETKVSGLYCVGDANGRCLLAHAASAQALVAVSNALGHPRTFDAPVPWAVYTFPEIAGVGLTQKQANEQHLPIAVGMFPLAHLGKAMASNHTEGFVKTIRHRQSDTLLGVHMMGHNATEVIAAAGAMLGQKASTVELAETIFAHPTMSEALKDSAEDALGMALHLPPRKLLKITAETK